MTERETRGGGRARIEARWLLLLVVLGCAGMCFAQDAKGKSVETAHATGPGEQHLDAVKKFETFCGTWLAKLRERERHNRAKIAWRREAAGVVGEYVGYDTESYRVLPPGDIRQTPVGKLIYMELRLRVSGESESSALARQPEIIERTEVTELFRYDSGSWVY